MLTTPTSPPLSRCALVTGASGFIGGHLAGRLADAGWQLRVLARDAARLPAALSGRCAVFEGALDHDRVLQSAVDGTEVVFHCAAEVATWAPWRAYESANVAGVVQLAQAVARLGARAPRIVHLSSADVYDFPLQAAAEDSVLPEGSFGYGRSKRLGEAKLRALCLDAGIACTVLRPCNVIGPGSQFIARIGAELRSGLMLTIDRGRAHAGLVDVDSLVDYMLWAAQDPVAVGEVYNVRDAYDANWAEVIDHMRRAIRGRGLVADLPFGVADLAARGCERLWGLASPAREPLLHRLLVRIFGRTCGHPADKIQAQSGRRATPGFEAALDRSLAWFMSAPAHHGR